MNYLAHHGVTRPAALDARALATRLARELQGEVRFDDGSRALYATDGSNYRQVPIGVVVPRTLEDVAATLAACRDFDAPVLGRGGGTSLAGQCCNVAVLLDFSKYLNRVVELNVRERWARVEPGVVLDSLRHAAEAHGLTFGPDPATHDHCTLGGMLGNNSCGVHSVMAQFRGGGPRTADNTLELDVMTYDGERLRVGATSEDELRARADGGGRAGGIYAGLIALRERHAAAIRERYPRIPRRVSGYNLDELLPEKGCNVARALVGSESTCAITLEARVALIEAPRARVLLVLGYPDVCTGADRVPEILEHRPIALEGLDEKLIGYMRRRGLHGEDVKMLPDGGGWLLVEFGGDSRDDARAQADQLMRQLARGTAAPHMRLLDDPAQAKKIWEVRESGLGATAFVPGMPDAWPGWEDSAVPPEHVGAYLRCLRKLFTRYGYDASLYGHIGQGCVHCRIPFELTSAAGIAAYRAFTDEAADLVLRFGGSFSGEHGDGQARADLLPKMYGAELMEAFATFKGLWDPRGRMNPGKVVDPAPRDEHLRLGTSYEPAIPATHFSFPRDSNSFARAALRCVGVGKCRRDEGGVMCPSYMATHEEKHSTRGRARLLFEMLRGETLRDGWRSEAVLDALDLCLACKGCKSDCPVNVDMATYKAEFMAHHYARRPRPRHMYFFGRIHGWARLAGMAPAVVNGLLDNQILARTAKSVLDVDPRRKLPRFATQTFRQWFRKQPRPPRGRQRVMLWPDTFTDHFHPQVARAAARVLENAGFDVCIPDQPMCCGRPLYDCGWLDAARARLTRIIGNLRDEIRAGTMLVVLEPSCCAVFRDELGNLLPNDPDATRLREQTLLLSELLMRDASGFAPRALAGRKAILHLQCHHLAVMKPDDELALLDRLGVQAEIAEPGCCGMAGPFGFRRGAPYEVSVSCAQKRLIPAVRAASDDTLVIASGYSCREQIAQLSGRNALHLAEVIAMAQEANP